VHRSLFARVKSGIEAVESKDTQKAYEFFSRHWPVGYWTLLDLWYRKIPDLDETGLKNLKSFTLDWTPSQALRSLWAFKAAAIYARITDLGGGDWPKEEYPPLARETSDQAGLYDFDPPRSKRGFGKFRQSLSDNDIDSVRTSVDRDDGELMHNADLLSRGHTEQDLRALSASIRSERFSQLRAYTNPRGVCPAAEVRELIHIRNPWPLSKSGRAYAKYVSTHPNEPIPVEVVRDRYEGTNKYLSCYVALNTEDDASEDDSVQVINFDASFFYDPPPGENGEPKRRSVVGAAIGYVLVPFGHDGPTDAQSWFDGLDISGQQMADVWKALRADYFPSKGIEDIEDFVALNPGRSVVIVDKIELLPKYRGKGIAPYLFELLSSAFDSRADGYDGCHIDGVVDSLWYVCASDLAFRREIAHIDGEIKPPREYVIPIGKPAVFVVAVNGERASALHPPMTQLLDSLARFRKNPSSPEEVIKRKLTAHFAQMARGRDYDIICYDPEEWPDT
jgi:GNAT superfamily N-acetyltransferase